MPRFIEGQDRYQVTLLPESLHELIAEDNADVLAPIQNWLNFRPAPTIWPKTIAKLRDALNRLNSMPFLKDDAYGVELIDLFRPSPNSGLIVICVESSQDSSSHQLKPFSDWRHHLTGSRAIRRCRRRRPPTGRPTRRGRPRLGDRRLSRRD